MSPVAVVLLHNGQVLQGRVERVGDRYQISLPDGELRVRAAEVEFVCRDLDEGYQRKLAAVQPGNVHQHLQLAQWCQRHGLLGCAAKELATAMDIDPRHPMIGVLQRRLQAALENPESPRRRAEADDKVPSAEELDRMVRGMPPGSVEGFAQAIQPILMNHCMTGGCHGAQPESRLQLMRAPLGQPASRRLTQRNLHAVLQWVDRDNPAASKLLTAVSGAHGANRTPIFTDRQALQYRRLTQWVYLVAEMSPPDTSPDRELESPEVVGASFEAPIATTRPGKTAKPRARAGTSDKSEKSAPGTPNADGDPFDPEVFNRQSSPVADPSPLPSASPPTSPLPSSPGDMPTPAARTLQGKTE